MNSEVKSENEAAHISYDLDMRLALLVQYVLGNKNDWKRLENMTGIKGVRWRHFYSGATKPSADMLEFFFTHYPQHAFWLATGLTDYEAGHTAPQVNLAFPGVIDGMQSTLSEAPEATVSYFKKCMSALDLCWNKWLEYVQHRATQQKLDRDGILTLYKLGINTSLHLGASETATAIGEQQQATLLDEISQARAQHLAAVLSGLRMGWEEADAAIDHQRELEAENVTELEAEFLAKPKKGVQEDKSQTKK